MFKEIKNVYLIPLISLFLLSAFFFTWAVNPVQSNDFEEIRNKHSLYFTQVDDILNSAERTILQAEIDYVSEEITFDTYMENLNDYRQKSLERLAAIVELTPQAPDTILHAEFVNIISNYFLIYQMMLESYLYDDMYIFDAAIEVMMTNDELISDLALKTGAE